MAKRILEEQTERLIAYKFLTSTTGRISDRAKRKYEKRGEEVGKRLKEGDRIPESSPLILNLRWSDRAVSYARNISLALEEFRQVNPEAYQQFQEILSKHRSVRRAYLEFGGEIPDEVYISVIREVVGEEKISEEEARAFYNSLHRIGEGLKKKREEGLSTLLLPE